jgi:hypothetical protein
LQTINTLLSESSIRRATAVHAIDAKIKKLVDTHETRIPIGYAAIFPNVIWVEKGAEWDREMICDREDLSNFNHWLKELYEYWNCQRPAKMGLEFYLYLFVQL